MLKINLLFLIVSISGVLISEGDGRLDSWFLRALTLLLIGVGATTIESSVFPSLSKDSPENHIKK